MQGSSGYDAWLHLNVIIFAHDSTTVVRLQNPPPPLNIFRAVYEYMQRLYTLDGLLMTGYRKQ